MAPVVRALQAADGVECLVAVTGQHRAMLDQVLSLFEIQPDIDLDIMRADQGLTHITMAVLEGIGRAVSDLKPDRVLVHGDTTTAFSAALAAFYGKVPVGHVEAGLRTGDVFSPWPEEMNRLLADTISDLYFAPTEGARDNLLAEGADPARISVTGNTVVDALFLTRDKLKSDPDLRARLDGMFPFLDVSKRLVLVTGHRRENFGRGFESVCAALARLASRDDVQLVYPVHLNPNVQKPVNDILGGQKNIHLIEPLDYLPFVHLMDKSFMVITDSGGIQEEAPSLGKPVLVTREKTERPEAVTAGTVKLVGTDTDGIVRQAQALLEDEAAYRLMSHAHNPYGDGKAAERIVARICEEHG